ncbi:ankyrin, partial [Choiromyces venosus 120613-1]
ASRAGYLPLHWAIQANRPDVVGLLLEREGIDHNKRNEVAYERGHTALSMACLQSHEQIVEVLLRKSDIQVSLGPGENWTPLHHAMASGKHNIVRMLLEDGRSNVNAFGYNQKVKAPVHIAAYNRDVEMMKMLLADERVDVNSWESTLPAPYNGRLLSPLHFAVQAGYDDLVNLLLADERVDVNLRPGSLLTPIFYAINGGEKMVQLLVDCERVDLN